VLENFIEYKRGAVVPIFLGTVFIYYKTIGILEQNMGSVPILPEQNMGSVPILRNLRLSPRKTLPGEFEGIIRGDNPLKQGLKRHSFNVLFRE